MLGGSPSRRPLTAPGAEPGVTGCGPLPRVGDGAAATTVAVVSYRFQAELWVYLGENPWYFVTLPFDHADEIEELTRTTSTQRGFGSVRVRVTVGRTTWTTSVFPDSKNKSYVLPVKKQVRAAEGLVEGSPVDVEIELVDVSA